MFKRINKKEALVILDNPDCIALDIRDSDSFSNGHLYRFINLNEDQVSTFVENTPKKYPILIMCYHGNSSQVVANFLDLNGFTDVSSIDGGYEGWNNS